jgi:predicted PurR-regulated permease PerM
MHRKVAWAEGFVMIEPVPSRSNGQQFLQTLAALVLVVASLYWAQKVLIPIALAILFAFVLAPAVIRLQHYGLRRIPAVAVTIMVALAVFAVICWGVAAQLRNLLDEIPRHRAEIDAKLNQLSGVTGGATANLVDTIRDISDKLSVRPAQTVTGREPQPVVLVNDGSSVVTWLASAVGTVLEFVISMFFMIVLLVFMLARREEMRNRFFQAVGRERLVLMSRAVDTAAQRISRYLRMLLLVNFGLGVLWAALLFVIPNGEGGHGVPYPLVWGALLMALRFVPYVGTWVAMIFPVLLSMALSPVGHPWLQALLLTSVFLVLEVLAANVVEPLVFGRNAGVSPVALLVAAVFWSWLWGPVGLVLSTPLTVCLVVLGKYVPQLGALNVLFGSDPPAETGVSYYQRLLVHDEDEATEIVQARLKTHRPAAVFDELILPALILSRRDVEAGLVASADERFVVDVTRGIIDEIVSDAPIDRRAVGWVEVSGNKGANVLILGCPARGEFDELALHMLDQLLPEGNYQTDILSPDALTSEVVDKVRRENPILACISSVPPGGLAQASYLCKRLRKKYPALTILVGRWGQTEDVERTRSRLQEAGALKVVTSLAEMCREIVPLLSLKQRDPTSEMTNTDITPAPSHA